MNQATHTFSLYKTLLRVSYLLISSSLNPQRSFLTLLLLTGVEYLPYFNESEPATISIPIPSDSVYTGVQEFRVTLWNSLNGVVFFTLQQTTIRVIDDDGKTHLHEQNRD